MSLARSWRCVAEKRQKKGEEVAKVYQFSFHSVGSDSGKASSSSTSSSMSLSHRLASLNLTGGGSDKSGGSGGSVRGTLVRHSLAILPPGGHTIF